MLVPPLLEFGVIAGLAPERTVHFDGREGRLLDTKHAEFSHKVGAYTVSWDNEDGKGCSLEGPAPTTITVYRVSFSLRFRARCRDRHLPFQQTLSPVCTTWSAEYLPPSPTVRLRTG